MGSSEDLKRDRFLDGGCRGSDFTATSTSGGLLVGMETKAIVKN
jgi:hypothetical protein